MATLILYDNTHGDRQKPPSTNPDTIYLPTNRFSKDKIKDWHRVSHLYLHIPLTPDNTKLPEAAIVRVGRPPKEITFYKLSFWFLGQANLPYKFNILSKLTQQFAPLIKDRSKCYDLESLFSELDSICDPTDIATAFNHAYAEIARNR